MNYLKDLMLEVTRNCNMECMHCLRGPAQRRIMKIDVVRKMGVRLKELDINYIGTLSFGGGEPTMRPDIIEQAVRQLFYMDIRYGSFWLSTNAKKVNGKIIEALNYAYDMGVNNEDEIANVQISNDSYHEELNEKNAYRLSHVLNEECRFKSYLHGEIAQYQLWRGGKCDWASRRYLNYQIDTIEEWLENNHLYLNYRGDVIPDCNLSYAEQEITNLGNVYKHSLKEMFQKLPDVLENYNKRMEEVYKNGGAL